MANGPPAVAVPQDVGSKAGQASATGGRTGLRRAGAGATAGVLLGLVAGDVWVAGMRAWWDRHALTSCVVSSLLVLGVTVLIIDEVLARRRRKERAVSVAVQALIVYAQAVRSCDAVVDMVLAGEGGGGTDPDVAQVDVRNEVRSLASMILVASPALFDDPEARLFLEDVQRLAGTMYGALALHKLSAAPGARGADNTVADNTVATLKAGRSRMGTRISPLAARLADGDRASLDAHVGLDGQRPVATPAPRARKVTER